ncbi:general substrate transporter [Xylaria nigripes]|nr:general substrate transporter [Xylaria nigripes]
MASLRRCMKEVSPFLLLLVAVSTLGPLQYGFHLAALNAPQDVISCRVPKSNLASRLSAELFAWTSAPPTARDAALSGCIPMNNAQFAVVSSMFTFGGLFGALSGGPISSSRGRLFVMRLTALFFVIGSVFLSLASSIAVMSIGRVLAGVGAGAATVTVPIYISEIVPPDGRGTFGAMTQISINVGILGTQTLGYYMSHGSTWRWIFGIAIVIAAFHLVCLLMLPESPAWLATNQDASEARRILQRIRGNHYDIGEEAALWNPVTASAEEEALLNAPSTTLVSSGASTTIKASGKSHVHLDFFEVVKDAQYRPALVAAAGVMCAQQLCGINSIIMYSVSLLKDLLPINSGVLTIIISAINLITTIACSPLPDKFGRKTCLLLSIIGQGTSALALAVSIVFESKIVSALAVLFFVAFFAVGLGPVPFILASEMVGPEAVGAVQSCCLGANYFATFLVAQFFPIINSALNQRFGGAGWVYFIFTGLALLWGLFVLWRVPETKGKKDANDVWGRTRRVD